MYIYQNPDWPNFSWDDNRLINLLGNVRNFQGRLIGQMEAIGFSLRGEAILETLTTNVVKSSLIEGEVLDSEQVRSSIARKLGMDIAGLVPSKREVDGIVEMMLDATQNYNQELTKERLFAWHAALFPSGRSRMYKIIVGDWRKDLRGPMQVVSGPVGKEKVHYEAPKAEKLEDEMKRFLDWFNNETVIEPVIKSGIAHLWFVTIHPFEDGNGRIARAIGDMQLARSEKTNRRYYSLSDQIEQDKKSYYEILESTHKGLLNITGWLVWYLNCLAMALNRTEESLANVLAKANFWKKHTATILNRRQHKMINKLLDDFYGKFTTSKWAKMNKCSQDTALRDIQDLLKKGILRKEPGGGRSTGYSLIL